MAQGFNGDWTVIDTKRLDGSKILKPESNWTQVIFRNDSVYLISKGTGLGLKLKMMDGKWKAGPTYFEYVNDSVLCVLDSSSVEESDKHNRYLCIPKSTYFSRMVDSGFVEFLTDSIIIANSYMPVHHLNIFIRKNNYNIQKYLSEKIRHMDGGVTGYFLLKKEGHISDVVITENRNFTKEERLKEVMMNIRPSWNVPNEHYDYRVFFTLVFNNRYNLYDFSTQFNDFDMGQKVSQIYIHDWRPKIAGLRYLKQKKYEKAIVEFSKLIAMDSLHTDAFYNRAYANVHLNKMEEACKDWAYLMGLEQVRATELYQKYCGTK